MNGFLEKSCLYKICKNHNNRGQNGRRPVASPTRISNTKLCICVHVCDYYLLARRTSVVFRTLFFFFFRIIFVLLLRCIILSVFATHTIGPLYYMSFSPGARDGYKFISYTQVYVFLRRVLLIFFLRCLRSRR